MDKILNLKQVIDRDLFVAKISMTFAVRLYRIRAEEADAINQNVLGPEIEKNAYLFNKLIKEVSP